MADEGNQKVGGEPESVDKGKGHPETVPWHQYVGVKEMLTKAEEKLAKAETELKEKVASLEEKLKQQAGSAEEVTKLQAQAKEAKDKADKAESDLKNLKEASLSEKRAYLIKKGVPEAEVKEMSEKELASVAKVVDSYKPKPDLGSGGGGVPLTGSPMELAQRAYSLSKSK